MLIGALLALNVGCSDGGGLGPRDVDASQEPADDGDDDSADDDSTGDDDADDDGADDDSSDDDSSDDDGSDDDGTADDDSGDDDGSQSGDDDDDGSSEDDVDAGSQGPSRDSGAGRDASTRDSGSTQRDAGSDGGGDNEPTRDAGAPSDAGRADAGQPDAPRPDTSKKFIGNITTRGQVREGFETMWNQITPENEGKWESVEPKRNEMNWGPMDRIYQFAKQKGVRFKQHVFVWGSQQPGWLASLSRADQAKEVEEWIRLFCERYPDVEMIDVVNEPPPHTTPVYMQALGGAGSSGYDWIVQSFRLARKYCPKAILILNDYNNIEYSADNQRFINIANAVKRAGAPIDAVGAQAHDAHKLPLNTVKGFLDKLANDTGLPVYITEYDLNIANDNQQRQVMQQQFPMFWTHSRVRGITLWGYVAGTTWLPNTGLMSASGTPRPALTWLLDYMKQQGVRP